MSCNLKEKTTEFVENGVPLKLQGVLKPHPELHEIHAEQLVKWCHGNEVWAVAVVENFSKAIKQSVPKAVQELLRKYSDVFG